MLSIIGTSKLLDSEGMKKSYYIPFMKMKKLKIYDETVNLFKKSIKSRTRVENSFMVFGMIMGHNAENLKQANKIWEIAWKAWNGDDNEKEVFDFLRKMFGALLMITVIEDSGKWFCYPDPEKSIKKS